MVENLAIVSGWPSFSAIFAPAVLAQGEFLGGHGIDDLQGDGFAALDLADGLLRDVQISSIL